VAEANAEAIAALPAGGTAVVPAHSPELEPHLGRDDIVYRQFDARDAELDGHTGRFRVDEAVVELELPFTQHHHAVNALAALHAYAALGLPLERAAEGAAGIRLSPWRGEELELPGGGFVINDAYNANPDAMRAALQHLAERAGGRRRVAILGEMAELGAASEGYHVQIGDLAGELDVEVLGVGEAARAYRPAVWAPGADGAVEAARGFLRPGDAVLVKGSRAVGLEGIAAEIAKIARAWSQS
jgi:UDP-N-acetylmuramoyl-tripeptide--D-alanyl-D-alanine ligase